MDSKDLKVGQVWEWELLSLELPLALYGIQSKEGSVIELTKDISIRSKNNVSKVEFEIIEKDIVLSGRSKFSHSGVLAKLYIPEEPTTFFDYICWNHTLWDYSRFCLLKDPPSSVQDLSSPFPTLREFLGGF